MPEIEEIHSSDEESQSQANDSKKAEQTLPNTLPPTQPVPSSVTNGSTPPNDIDNSKDVTTDSDANDTPLTSASTSTVSSSSQRSANSVQLSDTAYVKIISHAFKYANRGIVGLLLGHYSSSSSALPIVSDVLPLFHSHSSVLASTIELSLMLSSSYAVSNGLSIVGVYGAAPSIDSKQYTDVNQVTPIANKLMDVQNTNIIILTVDHPALVKSITQPIPLSSSTSKSTSTSTSSSTALDSKSSTDASGLSLFTSSSHSKSGTRQWQENRSSIIVSHNGILRLRQAMETDDRTGLSYYYQLQDFDDHLENVRLDWLNKQYIDNIT